MEGPGQGNREPSMKGDSVGGERILHGGGMEERGSSMVGAGKTGDPSWRGEGRKERGHSMEEAEQGREIGSPMEGTG